VQEIIMEQAYWLGRKQVSVEMVRDATDSEARLVHYDLAGRYSLKAMAAETPWRDLADILPPAIMPNRKNRTLRCADNG
jgi:hypothetical protein